MSKTILVEWPGLLFSNSEHILQNAAKFYPPKNVSSMQLQPSRQPASGQLPGPFTIIESGNFFMPAWVTGSLPPACYHAAGSAGLHRMRAIMFTNFFGYFSPCFVSACPRAHPRRIRWGSPVLRHTPFGELHENLVAQ